MKRSYFYLILSSILLLNIHGQKFTIEDIEVGRLQELAPSDLENIQWRKNSDNIVFSHNDTLFELAFPGKDKKVLVTLDDLNKKIIGDNGQELSGFPAIEFFKSNTFYFLNENSIFSYDISDSKLEKIFHLPKAYNNLALNEHISYTAFTLDSNVYILDQHGGQTQVTRDSTEGITNGQIVYRQEFGLDKGIFWSSGGNYFAFYHKDEKSVSEYPLVRIDKRVGELQSTRYPMAGMTSESTEIWVYSIADNQVSKLSIESPPDDYHTNISWSPDESAIYIQHLNREQNKMTLRSYSIPGGQLIKEIFAEEDRQYVEPLHSLLFSKKNPSDFFYQSVRDGFNHIYKYDADKNSLVQLTKGFWEVTELLGTDIREENLFFIATKNSPIERHLYKYNIRNKSIERLTEGKGTHTIQMNYSGDYFLDVFSGYSTPNRISVLDVKGDIRHVILDASNPVKNYALGEVVVDKIIAADDSTEIYYRMVKPVDFDSAKKYPVVVYVYGGPHVQLINNSWMDRIDYLQQYFAQHGYLSFTIDPRGSRNRGADFEQVIHRQSGIPQLEDHIKGIDYLKSLAYIDTSRIGVHGWSYGGYMTIFMMLTHPEIFKVGVSGGPVIDWKYYEVMYGERYMDTPGENPDGYELTNLRNYTDSLKGDLLIIHGALDPTVVWQHSLSFVQSCIKSGVQPDYFVYPLHGHNVQGLDRVHLTRMITEYFFEHL